MAKRLLHISILIAAVAAAASLLLGCASPRVNDGRTTVVTTIFPLYDFVREVVGGCDAVEIVCLEDGTADMHSFSPSAQDILAIAECDVFVYVGGESDAWVADVLAQHPSDSRVVVSCFDVLGESLIAEDDPDEAEEGYDEHVWLSLRNAAVLTKALGETISSADAADADAYRQNAERYAGELEALDARYEAELAALPDRTLLVADRFPFAYLARDYSLTCFSAFSGCSAEAEVSFQVVAELADVLNEYQLGYVLVIDGGDTAVAESVISQSGRDGVEILSLCSMQAVTRQEMEAGVTYLQLMGENLEVLEEALA